MDHRSTDLDVFAAHRDQEGDIYFTKIVPSDRINTPFALTRFVTIDDDTFAFSMVTSYRKQEAAEEAAREWLAFAS